MLNVSVKNTTKIAAVGDIHEHPDQFFQILEKISPSPERIFVSVGDILDKGFGWDKAEEILDALIPLVEEGCAYVVPGNHELKHINRNKRSDDKYLRWLKEQPLAISFLFENSTRLTVVHGGVTPEHTWDDLGTNAETSYVRTVDESGKMIPLVWTKDQLGKDQLVPAKLGPVWHEVYDGRFGYIVSGHDAQKDGIPKFYNFSCNIDTACYYTGRMTCQVFGSAGREELITALGPAKRPQLSKS